MTNPIQNEMPAQIQHGKSSSKPGVRPRPFLTTLTPAQYGRQLVTGG